MGTGTCMTWWEAALDDAPLRVDPQDLVDALDRMPTPRRVRRDRDAAKWMDLARSLLDEHSWPVSLNETGEQGDREELDPTHTEAVVAAVGHAERLVARALLTVVAAVALATVAAALLPERVPARRVPGHDRPPGQRLRADPHCAHAPPSPFTAPLEAAQVERLAA